MSFNMHECLQSWFKPVLLYGLFPFLYFISFQICISIHICMYSMYTYKCLHVLHALDVYCWRESLRAGQTGSVAELSLSCSCIWVGIWIHICICNYICICICDCICNYMCLHVLHATIYEPVKLVLVAELSLSSIGRQGLSQGGEGGLAGQVNIVSICLLILYLPTYLFHWQSM